MNELIMNEWIKVKSHGWTFTVTRKENSENLAYIFECLKLFLRYCLFL